MSKKKPPQKPERIEHVMNVPFFGWLRCRHCGLINLKNRATERELRRECQR